MKKKLGRLGAILAVALFLLGAGYDFLSYWEMTEPGYVTLGILLAAATLWITEAVPLFVTSLGVLFLSLVWLTPVMQDAGMEIEEKDFLSQFFSDIVLLFLGGFVISAALHKQRLDEALAKWIIQKTGSSVPRLMIGVMGITAFLSMWLSNTAAAAMMLALVIPIVNKLATDDRYRTALILSIPFAANIGGLGTPIGSPPNAIAMQYMQQIDIAPSFGMWMLIGVPGVLGMLAVAWLTLTRLYRGHEGPVPVDETTIEYPSLPQMILVLVTLLVTVAGWVSTSVHGFTSGTIALIPILVFFSTGILKVADLRTLSWEVLLLMGGGLCLGTAVSESGLAEWLIALLPLDDVTPFWLMVGFGTIACLMSSIMSNTATANLIMPIILGLSVEPLEPLLIGVAFSCTLAMPLPVSTPPNAMTFSTDEIKVGDLIKAGTILTVVGLILAFTTGYWWWDLVGLF